MRRPLIAFPFALVTAITMMLYGCGDSTPLPDHQSPAAPSKPEQAQTSGPLEQGAFVAIAADELDKAARISQDCNLDAVADKPAANADLDHAATPLFSGWIADTATGSVPATGRLVLKGTQDFVLPFHTGQPRRDDVAQALKLPALAAAGYQVQGNLAAVTPGSYSVVLMSVVGGQTLRCDTSTKVTVR